MTEQRKCRVCKCDISDTHALRKRCKRCESRDYDLVKCLYCGDSFKPRRLNHIYCSISCKDLKGQQLRRARESSNA
jgi:hypothetical protein